MQDTEIIRLYIERSQQAVTETRMRYGRTVRHIIGSILHDPLDAEECENDTYLAAWRSIPPNQPVSLKAYLACLARNTAVRRLDYNNAAKRKPEEAVLPFEELCESIADDRASGAADNQLGDAINGFLATLKPKHRRIFLLRYWQYLSVEEVAAETGCSVSNVSVILSRTRKKLKDYLRKEGFYHEPK